MQRTFAIGRPVAVLLLTVIAFAFLHSELDWWEHEDDDHGNHDYCDLLTSAPTLQKVVKQGLMKDLVPLTAVSTDEGPRPVLVLARTVPFIIADRSVPGLHIRYCSLLI